MEYMEDIKPSIKKLFISFIKDGKQGISDAKTEYSEISPEDKKAMIKATKEVEKMEKELTNYLKIKKDKENKVVKEQKIQNKEIVQNNVKDEKEDQEISRD